MSAIRAGEFDRTITIDRATDSIDDAGTITQTWATVFTLRAKRLANSAADQIAAAEGSTTVTTETFNTRYVDSVTLEDRVSFEGQAFTLKEIREIGRRRGLRLKVESVG
jgi:SPP1 family predicted phage head-tail adaptor